jgi:methyl acetate hydrolase
MESIDELLAGAVASGAHVGGAAIAATADAVVHESGFGTRVSGGEPVVADTPFRIASMTKALTTVAVLQRVEQGRVGLDDDVAAIVPAFGELQVLDGFAPPRRRPFASCSTTPRGWDTASSTRGSRSITLSRGCRTR